MLTITYGTARMKVWLDESCPLDCTTAFEFQRWHGRKIAIEICLYHGPRYTYGGLSSIIVETDFATDDKNRFALGLTQLEPQPWHDSLLTGTGDLAFLGISDEYSSNIHNIFASLSDRSVMGKIHIIGASFSEIASSFRAYEQIVHILLAIISATKPIDERFLREIFYQEISYKLQG